MPFRFTLILLLAFCISCNVDQELPEDIIRPGEFIARDSVGGEITYAEYVRVGQAVVHPDSLPAHAEKSKHTGHSVRPVHFERLTVSDGLPYHTIRAIHVDREGYQWVAYGNGMIRSDGYDFVYLDEARPMYPGAGRFHEDKTGKIWIPNWHDTDLCLYLKHEGVIYRLSMFPENERVISRMREDVRGGKLILSSIWHTNQDSFSRYRLTRFDHDKLIFPSDTNYLSRDLISPLLTDLVRIPDDFGDVSDFVVDDQDAVWLLSEKGLIMFDPETSEFEEVLPIPSFHYNKLILDDNRSVWYGMADGVVNFNTISHDSRLFPFPETFRDGAANIEFTVDGMSLNGEIAVGGLARQGWPERVRLFWLDPNDGHYIWLKDIAQEPKRIMSASLDRFGNRWIGSFGVIFKYNEEGSWFQFMQSSFSGGGLSGAGINTMYEDDHDIVWVGTLDGVLNRWDRKTNSFSYYRHDPNHSESLLPGPIISILRDSSGKLWVASRSGLSQMQADGSFRHYTHFELGQNRLKYEEIRAMYEDSRGAIWVATENLKKSSGLQQYDSACDCFISSPLLQDFWAGAIAEDSTGRIWFGAGDGKGLISYNPSTGSRRHHHSYGNQQPMDIHIDHEGNIWEGCFNMPLMKYNPHSGARVAYDLLGLYPSNPVRAILEDDDGMLWLGCAKGLIQFDPVKETVLHLFSSDTWMPADDNWSVNMSSIRCNDGTFLIGTQSGILMFDPGSIHRNMLPPQTAITGVNAAGMKVRTTETSLPQRAFRDEIRLPFFRNDVEISYTGLHLKDPDENRFAYQLVGWDDNWRAAGTQRTVSYPNLAPGEYTFRVKAANSDGVWLPDDRAVELPVVIEPPWWETWWAYVSYGLILISALWVIYRWRTRSQRRKLAEQKQINAASARFVPSAFLSAIGRQNILEVQLGDLVEREVTVLFSDIRDYTSIAEGMTPEENFRFVNAFSGRMGPVIQQHNGFVNQYLGDGIMAIFPEEPVDALRGAIEMHRLLGRLNAELVRQDRPEIRMGTGLDSGLLIMGVIGDEKRLDAATISDTVNTASRIESLTKYYRVPLILSGDTRKRLGSQEEFHLRYLGKVLVKGKNLPIDIYECFDANPDAEVAQKIRTKNTFEAGITHYLTGAFNRSARAFQEVIAINPEDGAAMLFYQRSKELARTGVPDGWKGVEEVTFK